MARQTSNTVSDAKGSLESKPRAAGSGLAGNHDAPRAYLRVFGPETGAFQFDLPERTITIGRGADADLKLPDPTVSRIHSRISFSDGQYTLHDAASTRGTTVNGRPIESHALKHGDSIVIAMYQLEFRTHAETPGAARAAARARTLLRGEYHTLPANAPLRFRVLSVAPDDVFHAGDTLELGCGGVLIPSPTAPDDVACLELHVSWPNQTSSRYLGEIQGVIREEETFWMCVKLHGLPIDVHEQIVAQSSPGPWYDVRT